MPRTRAVSTSIYQVLVTLQRIKPPIWRRLLLPSDLRLGKLHRVLHCVFEWENYHLHQFVVGDTFYGMPDRSGAMTSRCATSAGCLSAACSPR